MLGALSQQWWWSTIYCFNLYDYGTCKEAKDLFHLRGKLCFVVEEIDKDGDPNIRWDYLLKIKIKYYFPHMATQL